MVKCMFCGKEVRERGLESHWRSSACKRARAGSQQDDRLIARRHQRRPDLQLFGGDVDECGPPAYALMVDDIMLTSFWALLHLLGLQVHNAPAQLLSDFKVFVFSCLGRTMNRLLDYLPAPNNPKFGMGQVECTTLYLPIMSLCICEHGCGNFEALAQHTRAAEIMEKRWPEACSVIVCERVAFGGDFVLYFVFAVFRAGDECEGGVLLPTIRGYKVRREDRGGRRVDANIAFVSDLQDDADVAPDTGVRGGGGESGAG
jgi:hypothetical protein